MAVMAASPFAGKSMFRAAGLVAVTAATAAMFISQPTSTKTHF